MRPPARHIPRCAITWCRRHGSEPVTIERNGSPWGVGLVCRLHRDLARIRARAVRHGATA